MYVSCCWAEPLGSAFLSCIDIHEYYMHGCRAYNEGEKLGSVGLEVESCLRVIEVDLFAAVLFTCTGSLGSGCFTISL